MATERRLPPLGRRGAVLLALLGAAGCSVWYLGLGVDELIPSAAGLELTGRFLSHALAPALTSESAVVTAQSPPLLVVAVEAAWTTFVYAAAAMGLSIAIGLVLGFFASTAWWVEDPAGCRSWLGCAARRTVLPAIYGLARTTIAGMRAIHELLWAVLFLTAFGLNDVAALFALAIPYGGTLAKIYSEMADEAPRDAGDALRAAGATGAQTFVLGLIPRAMPDLIAYTFYRFECALRASAVLGFFGFETIGLRVRQSFSAGHFGEVWTYLYALVAMIVVFDYWSGALRRRLGR